MALVGQKNGVIRCQPVPDSKSLKDLKHYWSNGFHDNEYGHLTHICFSFDERFVFSAGSDSNIFGYFFNVTPEALERAKVEKIRIATKVVKTGEYKWSENTSLLFIFSRTMKK